MSLSFTYDTSDAIGGVSPVRSDCRHSSHYEMQSGSVNVYSDITLKIGGYEIDLARPGSEFLSSFMSMQSYIWGEPNCMLPTYVTVRARHDVMTTDVYDLGDVINTYWVEVAADFGGDPMFQVNSFDAALSIDREIHFLYTASFRFDIGELNEWDDYYQFGRLVGGASIAGVRIERLDTPAAVPLPAAGGLLGAGLGVMTIVRRRALRM